MNGSNPVISTPARTAQKAVHDALVSRLVDQGCPASVLTPSAVRSATTPVQRPTYISFVRFRIRPMARIAVETVAESLESMPDIEMVTFCCFGADALAAYEQALG